MLHDFITAIKLRAIAVFLVVHLGLISGVYALARASALGGWDQTAWFFLAAIVLLYLGFVLGAFFIVAPILPWVRRARKVEHWTSRVMRDLPYFLEQLPKIVAAVQMIAAAWKAATASSGQQPRAGENKSPTSS